LDVFTAPQIVQVLGDEFAEAQSLIHSTHQNETTSAVPRDPWKSTFREVLDDSWNGPLGVDLLKRFYRVENA
jgi:hypothetical protein